MKEVIVEQRAARYAVIYDQEAKAGFADVRTVTPPRYQWPIPKTGIFCRGNGVVAEYPSGVTVLPDEIILFEGGDDERAEIVIDFDWPASGTVECGSIAEFHDPVADLPSMADEGWGLGEFALEIILVCCGGELVVHVGDTYEEFDYGWPAAGAVDFSGSGNC